MKEVRFQKKYIAKIVDRAAEFLQDQYQRESTIVFQAPTGSGKTYMISQALTALVKRCKEPFSFMWISVNSLHEQSLENLTRYLEDERLLDCITVGETQDNVVQENQIVFFNWESLIKKNNVFRLDNERDWNLKSVAANTKDDGRKIILIIDESHRTAKADKALEVVAEIGPVLTIEMTATPGHIAGTLIKIPLAEVIDEGMIKREILINPYARGIGNDGDLLDIALKRRKQLRGAYQDLGKSINPLLLVQVPNARAGDASNPEDYIVGLLAERGYTTSKGNLAIWLSEKKVNRELIELNDSPVEVLIFKEAIALGWDCPRAAILYLQREWRHERYSFNIQTLGRIMRMPEQSHYDEHPELNVGYVYSASDNFDIVQELAGDYVSSLQMLRDEDIYDRPIKLHSEFIRRKVELTRLSADFKQCLFEAAEQLGTKDLINPNVREVQKSIQVDGRIEIIDLEQTVEFDREYRFRKSGKQIADDYSRFSVEQAKPYMPKSSANMIKSSLRSWFKESFLDGDEDRVARVVTQSRNKPKFKELLALAKEIYGNRPEREDEVIVNGEWEIPEGVTIFKSNYVSLPKSKKSILKEQESQSFYVRMKSSGVPDLSQPEAKFIEQLEFSDDETEWWFKNGARDSKYLGIAYRKLDGRLFGFYPDFIIKTKKEVLIVEIKDNSAVTADNLLKLRAGQDYLTKYERKDKVRFYILSPDDFDNFFLSVRNQQLDSFGSSFEEQLLRYFKSAQVLLESKQDTTEQDTLELELYEELNKTLDELKDTKLRNDLLEISLQQAEENLAVIGRAFDRKKKESSETLTIPTPFNICILGEVSNEDVILQALQTYFTRHSIRTNDWSLKFVNNAKLKSSDVLRSLVKGQSKFNLIITAQLHHHAGKANSRSNLISELKNEKYIPHLVGCDPKILLTPDRALETVNAFFQARKAESDSGLSVERAKS